MGMSETTVISALKHALLNTGMNMTKAMWTDLFREIRRSRARFWSLFAIVALGVAFFSGVRASEPDMRISLDEYYDTQSFMDVRVISDLGMTDRDIEDLKSFDFVEEAEGVFNLEVLTSLSYLAEDGVTKTGDQAEVSVLLISCTDRVNKPYLMEGRLPEQAGECLIDHAMAENFGVKVGDSLKLESGVRDQKLTDGSLTTDELTVCGVCMVPAYLDLERGSGKLGDGQIDYVVLPARETFAAKAYYEVALTLTEAKAMETGSDEYTAYVETCMEKIRAMAETACERRTQEIRDAALKDAFAGEDYELAFSAQRAVALADAKEQAYNSGFEIEYDKAKQANFDTLYEEWRETYRKQIHDEMLEEARANADPEQWNPAGLIAFESNFVTWFQEQEETLKQQFRENFDEVFEKQYKEAFEKTWKEEYEPVFEETFRKQFDEFFEKQAKQKIDENVKIASWYVLDRSSVVAHASFLLDAKRIGKIGLVFPLLFFFVAALVSMTTMTRMIEESRLVIGTEKSLGYTGLSIAGKFILYAMFATLGGSVVGFLVGEKIFPYVIIKAYCMLYTGIPVLAMPYHASYALSATAMAVLCIFIGLFAVCMRNTLSMPAKLMRPPAPKPGKRILLERITPLWSRLSFAQKASARNVFRYKKRMFMTIFGIGGCMGLLLVGFGLRDSILDIAKYQYREIFRYDAVATTDRKNTTEAEWKAFSEYLDGQEGITNIKFVHSEYMDVASEHARREAQILVPESADDLNVFFDMRDRKTKKPVEFPTETGHVAVNEKLARMLELKAGDTLRICTDEVNYKEVVIDSIYENYILHYVCMSSETYKTLFGEAPDYTTLWLKTGDRSEAFEKNLAAGLLEHSACLGVQMTSALQDKIDRMLKSLNLVVVVLIVSAGLLAFVVLYNLNNINITERRREMATVKVLGFFDGEVAAYVYRDSVLLTLFGCIFGVFCGYVLHRFVIETVEIDLMMFGRRISLASVFFSILLTIAFSVVVQLMMYRKLKKIDMVESLKSVE
ncbi:MAG: ABC transporter permease [Lachnospiraceae bacterium]|nr:ABC transporter permease [Lachnospiraceae bacterium]